MVILLLFFFFGADIKKYYVFVSIDEYLLPFCDINLNHVSIKIGQEKKKEKSN